MLFLWEKAIINDSEVFWVIISDFSPTLANFVERLFNIFSNFVFFERAFFVFKL